MTDKQIQLQDEANERKLRMFELLLSLFGGHEQHVFSRAKDCLASLQLSKEAELRLKADVFALQDENKRLKVLLQDKARECGCLAEERDELLAALSKLEDELKARVVQKEKRLVGIARRPADYDFTNLIIGRIKVVRRLNRRNWICICVPCGTEINYADSYLRGLQSGAKKIAGCKECWTLFGTPAVEDAKYGVSNDNN